MCRNKYSQEKVKQPKPLYKENIKEVKIKDIKPILSNKSKNNNKKENFSIKSLNSFENYFKLSNIILDSHESYFWHIR